METREAVGRKLTQEPEMERRSASARKRPALTRRLLSYDLHPSVMRLVMKPPPPKGSRLTEPTR